MGIYFSQKLERKENHGVMPRYEYRVMKIKQTNILCSADKCVRKTHFPAEMKSIAGLRPSDRDEFPLLNVLYASWNPLK